MSEWHFYDNRTGLFLGRTFSGAPTDLRVNTPAGATAFPAGDYDPRARRVNAGALEDFTPPTSLDAQAQKRRRQLIERSIAQLETRQARTLREVALGQDGARERLEFMDNEIATLRAELNG